MLISSEKEIGYYQEFIEPLGRKASILITHSKKNSYNKCCIVHKASSPEKTETSSRKYFYKFIYRFNALPYGGRIALYIS